MAVMVYACANRGYPEGGPKDTTPPEVVAEDPVSFSLYFDKKRVNIYFNEFVQLKDQNEKFIISPPFKKKPKVRLKGKYIQVELPDTLKPNTTYSLDFADAIVDNNESNPLGFYRYVFSTGGVIDTLELSGQVVNAESNEPMMNVSVQLYSDLSDSIPLRQLPDYIARTDSSGFFRVTNIRDTAYRVVALEDADRNYLYTPEAEMFAYLDTVVRPMVIPLVRRDTFTRVESIVGADTVFTDSIVTSGYWGYGPSNLYLRVFQEKLTQLYMVDDDRKERERLDFVFSIPAVNDLKVELWDTTTTEPLPQDWYLMERSAGNDTITLWIKDSTVYKKDTLHVILTYLRSDSTGQHSLYADTSRYTFKEKKKVVPKGKKEADAKSSTEFLDIKPNISGDLDLDGRLALDFDRPVDFSTLEALQVSVKEDTLYQPMDFELHGDSLKVRRVYVDADWKPDKEYLLQMDSATVFDLYGRFNNAFEKKFKVRNEEYYGKVTLAVSGVEGPVLIQMYKAESGKSDNGKRKYTVLRQQRIDTDGEVVFELVSEGKYSFRAVFDRNDNGKWDTGLYLKGQQPEKVVYLPAEIAVKQNFDIEQEFNLSGTYKEGNDE